MLKERLKLSIDVEEMLFFSCSALNENDLDMAASFIEDQLEADSKNGYYRILIEDEKWVQALHFKYEKEIAHIEEQRDAISAPAGDLDYRKAQEFYEKEMIALSKKGLS